MKDRIVWLMIMVMCLAGYAGAATILLCSDMAAPGDAGDHNDDTLVAWLESLGHTVDTYGMDEVYREGSEGPPISGETFYDHCVAADLIFMSRCTSSGQVNDAGSPKAWNEVPTPLLLNGNAAMIRGADDEDRLGWATGDNSDSDGGSSAQTTWRFWDGEKDAYREEFFDWTGSLTLHGDSGNPIPAKKVGRFEDWPEGTYEGPVGMTDNLGTGYELAGGTRIIATFNDDDKGVWVIFPAGTDFDAGQNNPTTNRYGTSTAVRVYYGHWGYDTDNDGPGGTASSWDNYITDLYKDTLAGIIEELAGGGDPNINPPPTCNAGEDQIIYIDELPAQLAGTASDAGPENPEAPVGLPGGITSAYWVQKSGPGTVTFTAAPATDDPIADILNSTVMFNNVPGDYELMLQVYDIEGQDANDIVLVRVKTHDNEMLVGWWDFEGDLQDMGDNIEKSNGTFAEEEGGYPKYDPNSAIGNWSISLADPLPDVDPVDPNITDPNKPHIDLGFAPELDFGQGDWTVAAWIKTTYPGTGNDAGKGAIFSNGADAGGGHRYCLIMHEDDNGRTNLVVDDDSTKVKPQDDGPDNDDFWHFIVGVREDADVSIYRDGVLEDTDSLPGFTYDLSGTSAWNSHIGAIVKADEPNNLMYKQYKGLIDDVKVYNYALDEAEILALTAEGPIVAAVTVGGDKMFNWKPSAKTAPPLEGSIVDNGINPTTSGMWTSTDPGHGQAQFTDATDPTTTVTFPNGPVGSAPDVYTLMFEVTDPHAVADDNPGGIVSDSLLYIVQAPTCVDVVTDGLIFDLDFDGDCYIGLSDFVVILTDYLMCNDPLDVDCPWPF